MVLYEAGDLTIPRRRMRRPVAGGLPAPILEAWFQDAEEEEEWTVPSWTFFLIGVFGGSLALVAATGSVLAYLADRWLRQ